MRIIFNKNSRSQQQNQTYEGQKKKPGETTVNVPQSEQEKDNNKKGDYIDYEEVD